MSRGGSAGLAAMLKQRSTGVTASGNPEVAPLAAARSASIENINVPKAAAAPVDTYLPKTTTFNAANRCYVCDKTVYKTEEIIAVGQCWHDKCFTCSGKNNDGCKKVLHRDGYLDHDSQPYCQACYNKLFRTKGFSVGSSINTDYGGQDRVEAVTPPRQISPSPAARVGGVSAPAPPPPPAPPAAAPTAARPAPPAVVSVPPARPAAPAIAAAAPGASKKCCVCEKTVYKMEEIIAIGRLWHDKCFTCGGHGSEGCRKVLTRDGYSDHEGEPFCNACYSKLFRPKGFNAGSNINTAVGGAQGVVAASSTDAGVTVVPAVAAPAPPSGPIRGGSSGVASMIKQRSENFAPALAPPAAVASRPAAPPSKPLVNLPEANKCSICQRSVYQMEDIHALGRVWHTSCFTCGAPKGDGCGRTLKRGAYSDHENVPYCQSCFEKNFRPKGYGVGGIDSYPARSTSRDSNDIDEIPAVSASTAAMAPFGKPKPPGKPATAAPAAPGMQKATGSAKVAIGTSSKAAESTGLYAEASYVGENDEVDESEW